MNLFVLGTQYLDLPYNFRQRTQGFAMDLSNVVSSNEDKASGVWKTLVMALKKF